MRTTGKNILLLGWSVLTALAVGEFVLSVLDIPHFHDRHSFPPQFTFLTDGKTYGKLGYVNQPNRKIRFVYDGNLRGYFGADNEVEHTTNAMGLRARQVLPAHDTNMFRIVFLGDSFTFGEGVHDNDTYPARVEAMLASRYPGLTVQSLDLGVGGYNTVQEAEMLKLFGLPVTPDLVVLGYTMNDAGASLFFYDPSSKKYVRRQTRMTVLAREPNRPPDNFLYRHSRIAQLAWSALSKREKGGRAPEITRSLFRPDSPGWHDSRNALRDIAELCHARKIPVYAILFPSLVNLRNYPFEVEHRLILDTLTSSGFEVIDLLPPLQTLNRPDNELWVHPTDQHPNEQVHPLVAQLLSERIVSMGGMEQYARH
jgi:lysophospholipase L1-like esterase